MRGVGTQVLVSAGTGQASPSGWVQPEGVKLTSMTTLSMDADRLAIGAAGDERRRATPWQRIRSLVGIALGVALLALGLPALTGVPWGTTARAVTEVPPAWLVGLVALWALGLLVNTLVLRASLPTLTSRRALTLSLTGSAVANVMPLGGAAGIALNYRMLRSWGYTRSHVATYTVVSNIWDVLGKLVLVALVLPWVALAGSAVLGHVAVTALVVAVVAAAALSLAVAVLVHPPLGSRVAALAERASGAVLRLVGSARRPAFREHLAAAQQQMRGVFRRSWPTASLGVAGYIGMLFALLWAAMHVAGVSVPAVAIVAAFALDRLFTLGGITPGGTGLVELGLASVLLAAGGDPLAVTTGILLYRTLTFALEIPVGGVWLGLWEWRYRRAGRAAVGGATR